MHPVKEETLTNPLLTFGTEVMRTLLTALTYCSGMPDQKTFSFPIKFCVDALSKLFLLLVVRTVSV